MKQVIVGGVLFLLLVQASIVLCQIRMRPSQLKLSAINYPDVQVERDPREYKGQEQQESSEKKETKPMKVPAFVVTKIDEGISPDILSGYEPDEPRIPVLMAVKKTDQRRIKNSMASSESKKQDVKVNPQKMFNGPKLPYSAQTLEGIMTQAVHRGHRSQSNKQQSNLPLYHDESQQAKYTTTPPPTTGRATEDPMDHGGAEPVPSISIPSTTNPAQRPYDPTIPVIVGYRRVQISSPDKMETSESIGRPIYRASAASTDVYTIEDMLYGGRRPMHSNSIFYQKALSYLKQYRRAILQHRSYPERMVDDESPKDLVRAYDPMTPLIHMQNGPTVPGGYHLTSYNSGNSGYGRQDQQEREEQFKEAEDRSQESPQDAIAVQDGDHNVIGFLPVISVGGGSSGSSSYSGSSYGQSQSTGQQKQGSSSLRKPLSPSLKLQTLLRSSKKGSRGGERTIPFLTMGFRQQQQGY